MDLDPKLLPLVGEYAWHSVTTDPRIAEMSQEHYRLVRRIIAEHLPDTALTKISVLEVACYAHTTGYELMRETGCDVTLFELSAATLRLGRSLAPLAQQRPRLVIGDFHHLPFADGAFDFVFICSALHHTWDFPRVAQELMRVVRPGGILFIENEPCLREACFYKFRCNRESNFTVLENHLWQQGWLRTFAEPYVGSRPETLFGMIENQKMPLPELLALFRNGGVIERIQLSPESCINRREQAWIDARQQGAGALAGRIRNELLAARRDATDFLGSVETGLGFTLPDDREIAALADRTAQRLAALPDDEQSDAFRCGLTELFGGAVQLIIRRSGTPAVVPPPRVPLNCSVEADGVLNAFPPNAQKLLGQRSLLPSLQEAPAATLRRFFPEEDWEIHHNDHAGVGLVPKNNRARIETPTAPNDLLLILRLHCETGSGTHYTLRLMEGQQPHATIPVHHSESRLCLATFPGTATGFTLEVDTAGNPAFVPQVVLSYAGLFARPPSE